MEFKVLKDAVAKRFAEMCKSKQLYRTGISGDDLWFSYLSAFPDGTNPIYRDRTEHDCSCCKSFIRAVGNVVAIVDGKLVSIWDVKIDEPAYQAVANALSKRVKMFGITDTFLHWDKVAGVDKTFEQLVVHSDLDKHRKVLELVGSKTKVADTQDQLSGLGFSSTQRNNIQCRITGSFSRIINLVF